MTTIYESPTDRQDDINNVIQCLGTLVNLQLDFPDEYLNARQVPQKVQDDLEELQRVTCWLCYQGASIIWEYAKARGLAEEVAKVVEEDRLPAHWSVNGTFVGEPIWRWREETQS